MKTIRYFIFWGILSSLILGHAGIESSGGGGNGAEAEFRRMSDLFVSRFLQTSYRGNLRELGKDLELLMPNLIIEISHETLWVDGKIVTAINYPNQKRIILNENQWAKLDRGTKMQLVIHELLRIVHGEKWNSDMDYNLSREFLQMTLSTSAESVAFAMARSNSDNPLSLYIQEEKTRVLKVYKDKNGKAIKVTEVIIEGLDIESKKITIRYHIYEDSHRQILKAIRM